VTAAPSRFADQHRPSPAGVAIAEPLAAQLAADDAAVRPERIRQVDEAPPASVKKSRSALPRPSSRADRPGAGARPDVRQLVRRRSADAGIERRIADRIGGRQGRGLRRLRRRSRQALALVRRAHPATIERSGVPHRVAPSTASNPLLRRTLYASSPGLSGVELSSKYV